MGGEREAKTGKLPIPKKAHHRQKKAWVRQQPGPEESSALIPWWLPAHLHQHPYSEGWGGWRHNTTFLILLRNPYLGIINQFWACLVSWNIPPETNSTNKNLRLSICYNFFIQVYLIQVYCITFDVQVILYSKEEFDLKNKWYAHNL